MYDFEKAILGGAIGAPLWATLTFLFLGRSYSHIIEFLTVAYAVLGYAYALAGRSKVKAVFFQLPTTERKIAYHTCLVASVGGGLLAAVGWHAVVGSKVSEPVMLISGLAIFFGVVMLGVLPANRAFGLIEE